MLAAKLEACAVVNVAVFADESDIFPGWEVVPSGVGIGWVKDDAGFIAPPKVDHPPLTAEDVERLRLTAYADPLAGSDRYFAEAARMQAMGESGWEDVRASGVARYQEIQGQYPWPEVV